MEEIIVNIFEKLQKVGIRYYSTRGSPSWLFKHGIKLRIINKRSNTNEEKDNF